MRNKVDVVDSFLLFPLKLFRGKRHLVNTLVTLSHLVSFPLTLRLMTTKNEKNINKIKYNKPIFSLHLFLNHVFRRDDILISKEKLQKHLFLLLLLSRCKCVNHALPPRPKLVFAYTYV